ncbi:conserved hypothetical protein [Talaromyces stipitatus ATCC 10500]|uniref:Uncharacterized protein n=1 Tax=Talaromyces stipitatus (strain ATCC 10500 / CBS 375.48 / QM 6759 / NRRL 1006) TaxID=441959 RepID=B8LX57_TALSN|nr:uncharacterized protein TSTA_061950 [Talaromyces stipitatus ATCC 10500]EED22707.1 conserved hypothetical protein [Talaromyces stipitatus ATCC 10500]
MPQTLPLLRGKELTYSAAREEEVNIVHQLGYHAKQIRFFAYLRDRRDWMRAIVSHHLCLPSVACQVATEENWLHGSYNVCVPVTISCWNKKRVLIRFPLPYRIGEAFRPGNGDEKIRCEAGTYAWLQENCPDVPIPKLYGFALSTGETFSRLENFPIVPRYLQIFRRHALSLLGYPIPSNYVRHPVPNHITLDGIGSTGYLLIEFIEEAQGTMLSDTWTDGKDDVKLRGNLFRSLSRILLSMSRISLPRIGSFAIDNSGFLHLANRPLSIEIQELENENIPTDIPRDYTYSTADSYIIDLLSIHDSRLKHQPNALKDLGDFAYQLSALSAMRTVFTSFFHRDFRRGPFSFTLTDLHQSNIFVDAQWNITCLVDLEWACSRPIEMLRPPYWLTNKGVDQLVWAEYNSIRMEFMEILAGEETKIRASTRPVDSRNVLPYSLTEVMNRTWATGTFWYTLALSSPSGLFSIFHKQIRPLFCPEIYGQEFNLIMPFFWEKDIGNIVRLKTSHKKKYDEDLRRAFEDS